MESFILETKKNVEDELLVVRKKKKKTSKDNLKMRWLREEEKDKLK